MSKLEDYSAGFRKTNIARNSYNTNDEYNAGHPDALSTGDEEGKGELNGSTGGKTDIKVRTCEVAKNKYQQGKQYDVSTA